ncbi:MAG: hypothetical protein ACRCYX_04075 [Dermatophilaceae bacterium]
MVDTVTEARSGSDAEARHQLATVILHEHTDENVRCAVRGCAFPCAQALLAKHGPALL